MKKTVIFLLFLIFIILRDLASALADTPIQPEEKMCAFPKEVTFFWDVDYPRQVLGFILSQSTQEPVRLAALDGQGFLVQQQAGAMLQVAEPTTQTLSEGDELINDQPQLSIPGAAEILYDEAEVSLPEPVLLEESDVVDTEKLHQFYQKQESEEKKETFEMQSALKMQGQENESSTLWAEKDDAAMGQQKEELALSSDDGEAVKKEEIIPNNFIDAEQRQKSVREQKKQQIGSRKNNVVLNNPPTPTKKQNPSGISQASQAIKYIAGIISAIVILTFFFPWRRFRKFLNSLFVTFPYGIDFFVGLREGFVVVVSSDLKYAYWADRVGTTKEVLRTVGNYLSEDCQLQTIDSVKFSLPLQLRRRLKPLRSKEQDFLVRYMAKLLERKRTFDEFRQSS